MTSGRLWPLLRKTASSWNDHEAPRLSAALAFYSILSLAPLVILVVAILALVFGHATAQESIVGQVEGMIGQEGAGAIRAMIEHAQKPATGTFVSIIGVVTLLFGASGVFGELRAALNKMWDVGPVPGKGIWTTIRSGSFHLVWCWPSVFCYWFPWWSTPRSPRWGNFLAESCRFPNSY